VLDDIFANETIEAISTDDKIGERCSPSIRVTIPEVVLTSITWVLKGKATPSWLARIMPLAVPSPEEIRISKPKN